ncbi:hypothetical protein PU372_004431 [Salmonella enterica]|nr:hypothetical protein [Salmonella enterica subsp. houtenae]EAQ6168933.1 hypothetical protein [Salmonella enterica]EDW4112396.1 hypothetical protein [Salmonella enterica subsp. arizonae]EEA6541267.1 hypothetical protein [Salmonella enterica subsp. enterica serovar Bonariensis]MBA2980553.1 hypothetical protein [Salmonella enterica subsp. houtenae serovar 48:z4,z32:-]
MTDTVSTHSENRWVKLDVFCERSGVPLRRARYWYQNGRLKIKPKAKAGEHVYVDWLAWTADQGPRFS